MDAWRYWTAVGCALVALAVAPSAASSQRCHASALPYFEFQVSQRVAYLRLKGQSPRPMRTRPPDPYVSGTLVQFVVDTAGVPDAATYKVLASPDSALARAGRREITRWRFRPARVAGCRVAQVYQTLLEP